MNSHDEIPRDPTTFPDEMPRYSAASREVPPGGYREAAGSDMGSRGVLILLIFPADSPRVLMGSYGGFRRWFARDSSQVGSHGIPRHSTRPDLGCRGKPRVPTWETAGVTAPGGFFAPRPRSEEIRVFAISNFCCITKI